jgi:two-component system chemotaxis response regulator CheB
MVDPPARARFGRGLSAGALTDLGCPDCPGVLEVRPAGDRGYLTFACRVGHAYSAPSLIDAKESVLEDTLWSAVTRLDELVSLYEDFAPRTEAMARPELGAAYRQRLEQVRGLLERLRALAEENLPPIESRPG